MTSRTQITDRLALDPNLSYGGVTRTSEIVLPISYQGVGTNITAQTIPGGALGPNGYLELRLGGIHAITANSTPSMTAAGFSATLSGPVLTGGTTYYLDSIFWIQNQNSEANGVVVLQMDWVRDAGGTAINASRTQATHIVDTSADWTLGLFISTSSAASGTATIDIARVTAYFIP